MPFHLCNEDQSCSAGAVLCSTEKCWSSTGVVQSSTSTGVVQSSTGVVLE